MNKETNEDMNTDKPETTEPVSPPSASDVETQLGQLYKALKEYSHCCLKEILLAQKYDQYLHSLKNEPTTTKTKQECDEDLDRLEMLGRRIQELDPRIETPYLQAWAPNRHFPVRSLDVVKDAVADRHWAFVKVREEGYKFVEMCEAYAETLPPESECPNTLECSGVRGESV